MRIEGAKRDERTYETDMGGIGWKEEWNGLGGIDRALN